MGNRKSREPDWPPPELPPPPIYPPSFTTTTISRRRRKRLPPKIRVIFVPQVPPIGIGCVAPMPCAVPVANPCCNLGIAGYGGFGYGGYSGLGGRCCFL
ncbi:unnamed protein product [Rotaria sordida]|uniref:Uncharacterized protein n=1 Tax=Rotaria sordida TaxID=392033 RepID=A0A819IT94_9BILA|nr:unnamed protein product [Rotaria sordida]CAF1454214.1 unnamed protein product [Rotaria sordida]CAF3794795.1 unnamed protein product [Rotaria sordida]CAF3919480.1 unnamed protein product [Rotaria sordida]